MNLTFRSAFLRANVCCVNNRNPQREREREIAKHFDLQYEIGNYLSRVPHAKYNPATPHSSSIA